MYFLVDEQRKIAVGWSAKCGCTHIKRIWLYLTRNIDEKKLVHKLIPCRGLPSDVKGYTIFIIGRNPYERLVSGFREKYRAVIGASRPRWPLRIPLTFSNFVAVLAKQDWRVIDQHHFIPQTMEAFDYSKLQQAARVVVYDLKNIDYDLLGHAFGKSIPKEMRAWRGNGGSPLVIDPDFADKDMSQLVLDSYQDIKLSANQFYPASLRLQVRKMFDKDFAFFASHGINYN